MSAADPRNSSTPEAVGEVQGDSPAAEAGDWFARRREVVDGASGGGVPIIQPAPVYNKKGEVVEVA